MSLYSSFENPKISLMFALKLFFCLFYYFSSVFFLEKYNVTGEAIFTFIFCVNFYVTLS